MEVVHLPLVPRRGIVRADRDNDNVFGGQDRAIGLGFQVEHSGAADCRVQHPLAEAWEFALDAGEVAVSQ